MGKMGEGEWKIPASSYVMRKSWGKRQNIRNIVSGIIIALYADRW